MTIRITRSFVYGIYIISFLNHLVFKNMLTRVIYELTKLVYNARITLGDNDGKEKHADYTTSSLGSTP